MQTSPPPPPRPESNGRSTAPASRRSVTASVEDSEYIRGFVDEDDLQSMPTGLKALLVQSERMADTLDSGVLRVEAVRAKLGTPDAPRPPTDDSAHPTSGLDLTRNANSDTNLVYRVRDLERTLRDKDEYVRRLRKTIKELARRMQGVAEFIDVKEDIEERLERMEREHQEEISVHRNAARDARLDMLEDRVKLFSIEASLRETHERDVMAKATELLDQRTKEVNDQNFLLVKDKIILARDMESARRRRSVLEVENTELRRKIALSTGTEKELLQRSVKQKREVSKLKEQVKTTEDGLNSIVEEYEQRLAKLRADHEKSIKALTVERDDARNDAKKLLVELKRLRELSGQLVLQHSELEQFFYDALRTVRCEIVQERRRQIVGMPCSVGPSASQTASSTLRLQTQPRLMLTETANSTALPRLHQWGRDGKGLPVLLNSNNNKKKQKRTSKSVDSLGTLIKTNHSQLPYLHYDGDDHDEAHSRDEDPDAMNVEEEAEFFDDTAAAPSLRHIPDAPTMAQIQRVDIASMSWTEKERVIRYLFKRLQQQTHRRPAPADGGSDSTTTQDEAEMKMPPSGLVMRDSDTFLTQP